MHVIISCLSYICLKHPFQAVTCLFICPTHYNCTGYFLSSILYSISAILRKLPISIGINFTKRDFLLVQDLAFHRNTSYITNGPMQHSAIVLYASLSVLLFTILTQITKIFTIIYTICRVHIK